VIGVALAPLKSQKVLTPGKPNLPAKALHMSLPYALLHFEAQKAKERVLQLFHTEPGAHSDNLSPTLARGGHERAERRGQRIGGLPNLWQGGRPNLRSIARLVGRLSLSRQTNIARRFERLSIGIALRILALGFLCIGTLSLVKSHPEDALKARPERCVRFLSEVGTPSRGTSAALSALFQLFNYFLGLPETFRGSPRQAASRAACGG